MLDAERVGAWVNLDQTARVVQSVMDERLKRAAGLSSAEFELLMRLRAAAGKRLKMSEIASQLIASKSGITRMVERLVADGVLSRETPAGNRRVVYARLTTRGDAALVRAQAAFVAGLEETFSAHLSNAEVRSMRRIFRKLLKRNGAWAEDRCAPAFAAERRAG